MLLCILHSKSCWNLQDIKVRDDPISGSPFKLVVTPKPKPVVRKFHGKKVNLGAPIQFRGLPHVHAYDIFDLM